MAEVITIEYDRSGKLISESWQRRTELNFCPFCGEDSVYEQRDSGRHKDNIGDCHLCIDCERSFYIMLYDVQGRHPGERYIEKDLAKLISDLIKQEVYK